jgi:hypothetical protein
MAIKFVENFEWSGATELESYSEVNFTDTIGAYASVSTGESAGMFGRCIKILTSPTEFMYSWHKRLPAAYSSGLVSFAYASERFPLTLSPGHRIFSLTNARTHQIGLRREVDGTLSVTRDATVLGTTASPVITAANQRYRIEIGFVVHETTGSIRLDVNSSTVLNLTGIDTRNGIDNVTHLLFGPSRAGLTPYASDYFDDVLFDDDPLAFRGDWTGTSLYPSSDISGVSTPLSGTRWSNLNGSPSTRATYTTFTDLGQDLYELTDLAVTPDLIHAVAVLARGRKTHTGASSIRTRLKSGDDYANGVTRPLNMAPQLLPDIFMTNPTTGAAWTTEQINQLQVALERVS